MYSLAAGKLQIQGQFCHVFRVTKGGCLSGFVLQEKAEIINRISYVMKRV